MKNLIIGLTGQTGAGKSTVSGLLREAGCYIIDADQIARQVVEKGSDCIAEISLEFGIGFLNVDGTLDRRRLGDEVFADKQKLKRLNAVTFPYIVARITEELEELRRHQEGIIVLDAPTLLESGLDKLCDRVVSVLAEEEIRCQRIMERDGLSRQQAEDRIHAQHRDAYYQERSWMTLENNETPAALKGQTVFLLRRLEHMLHNDGNEPDDLRRDEAQQVQLDRAAADWE